jgi:nitroreductase
MAPPDRHSHLATKSFPRELSVAEAVLIVVHRDRHLEKLAGERERALVVRDRRAAIAADVEAVLGNKIEEAKLQLDVAGRYVVDQQRELARRRPVGCRSPGPDEVARNDRSCRSATSFS